MSVRVIAFFNNKGGVGKTALVYHLAWMFSLQGTRTLAADLDPQANLTAAFLDEDALEVLWEDRPHTGTVFGCIRPLLKGTGDIAEPITRDITDELKLLAGDLALGGLEDELSGGWPKSLDGEERSFRVLSAFYRLLQNAAEASDSELILVDLGPNLGSINRAALIAADFVVIPLSPDLFSLQGLRNLGPTFRRWRTGWADRLKRKPEMDISLPRGRMKPLGYVVLQHSVRLDRPVKAYDRWIRRIPGEYRTHVMDQEPAEGITVFNDPHNLALLKHYRSLMPMAQEARKPMFLLKPADGAIGAHMHAAQDAYKDFDRLAKAILSRVVER